MWTHNTQAASASRLLAASQMACNSRLAAHRTLTGRLQPSARIQPRTSPHQPAATTAVSFAGIGDACGAACEQPRAGMQRAAAHRRSMRTQVPLSCRPSPAPPRAPSHGVGGRPSSAPAAAATADRSAGRGGRAARWCIAHHLLGLRRCTGVGVGALVHWSSHRGAVRAGGRSTRLGGAHWARARYQRPSPFHPSSLSPPGSAAPAQGHFGHTLSVRRRSGAAPQRGGRLVARSFGHRSVARPSREHRGRLPRPGAALERADRPTTSTTETPVGGRRRRSGSTASSSPLCAVIRRG